MGSAVSSCCGTSYKEQTRYKDSQQLLVSQYHAIKLQNLKRKDQLKGTQIGETELIKQISKQSKKQQEKDSQRYYSRIKKLQNLNEKVFLYRDTGRQERILSDFNSFFNAFFCPYTLHGDVLLVPDDIWLMILIFLSKYIDSNAQRLRSKFVTFQGRKKLVVYQYANNSQQAQNLQKQWQYYFTQIIKKITQNTTKDTVQLLTCNFTTTTPTYKLISTSIIMSSFKQYFSYERCIMGCGINNIYFDGTREDWVKILEKLLALVKYDVDGKLKEYVGYVKVILGKFIETYDNNSDVKWWNSIMTSEERRVGSGFRSETFVQGWILHFYGIYDSVQAGKIPTTEISVPINLVNKITNKNKILELRSNWVSVSKINDHVYKPDIGVCLVEL